MGIINSSDDCKVTIIASHKSWIDSEAIEQLENIAGFDGMCLAVGLPDLHPGKEAPIGAAFVSQGWVYPHLVGNDIGCGMALWQTDLVKHKIKLEKWTNKLTDLENVWDGDLAVWLDRFGLESTKFNHSMGTIGGGNHFAELQSVEEVFDSALFSELEIDTNKLYLLVHSGSRGIGEDILS